MSAADHVEIRPAKTAFAAKLQGDSPLAVPQSFAAESSLQLHDASFARALDAKDELAHLRADFHVPTLRTLVNHPPAGKEDEEVVYLCGNSLGLQPKETARLLTEELSVWSHKAVNGHFDHDYGRPWVTIDETVKDQAARLVGAKPLEVAILNSLTVNIHLLMGAFYRPTPTRYKILLEAKAFPSDHFAVESQARMHGYDPAQALVLATPREGEVTLRPEDILELIEREGDSVALVLFSGVQYYTGQLFDLRAITEAGHRKGCVVGFDLAHATGNVPLRLHEWGPDFAAWCSYKYLNSGPGGISAIFVHERHAHDLQRNRLVGWWAHEKATRFRMENEFVPMPGAAGFQQSNPCVLAVVALLGSLNVFERAAMADLRAKSLLLTAYTEHLLMTVALAKFPGSFQIITPADPARRGCQLSVLFSINIKAVHDRLEEQGVIVDKREPNVLRISPVPLYNTFADVLRCVRTLTEVLAEFHQ